MINYRYKGLVTRVVDGDTYDIEVDLGFSVRRKVRFRLYGINTEEITGPNKEKGLLIKNRVAELIENKIVVIQSITYDKYGRSVARIWYNQLDNQLIDLSETLIKEGLVHGERSEIKEPEIS